MVDQILSKGLITVIHLAEASFGRWGCIPLIPRLAADRQPTAMLIMPTLVGTISLQPFGRKTRKTIERYYIGCHASGSRCRNRKEARGYTDSDRTEVLT